MGSVIKLQFIAHPIVLEAYSALFFSIFLGRNFLFDQEIERVDWAEPEHEVRILGHKILTGWK